MSGRPAAPTRASTRVKTQPTVPVVTRTTRARAAPKSVTPPVEPLPAKKVMVRKPLVSKDSSLEIPAPAKPKTKAIGQTSKRNEVPDSDREPIMVSYSTELLLSNLTIFQGIPSYQTPSRRRKAISSLFNAPFGLNREHDRPPK